MGSVIIAKRIGLSLKTAFKPKAKLPKEVKQSLTNSPKTLHRKDAVTGVNQKKPVTFNFPAVLTEESEPLTLTPQFQIETKLLSSQCTFWDKIPTLIRYIILKTEFIRQHKRAFSKLDLDNLTKTAANLERLLGAILNQSLPRHQLIMLMPFASLKLVPEFNLSHLQQQMNKIRLQDVRNSDLLETCIALLTSLSKKPNVQSYATFYQNLALLTNDINDTPTSFQQNILKYALYIQVKGLLSLQHEFNDQWKRKHRHEKKHQALTFTLRVDMALPLFNYSNLHHEWYLKFEAIISSSHQENLKVLFRFSAGRTPDNMLPLQARGERLLSGRHVKFFKNTADAIDYFSMGFLLNLCHPVSDIHNTDLCLAENKRQQHTLSWLLNNLKLQQNITHQASNTSENLLRKSRVNTNFKFHPPLQSKLKNNAPSILSTPSTFERLKVPLLNQLLQEPLRLPCRNPQYFTIKAPHKRFGMITKKGDVGLKWIKNITQRVIQYVDSFEQQQQHTQKARDLVLIERQKIKQAITALNAEYRTYLNIAHQFDSASVRNYPKLRGVKRQLENDRGAKSRAEYLRAVICTHAALILAYRQSLSSKENNLNEQEISFCRYLSMLTQEYEHPDIQLSKEQADCFLAMTSVLKDKQVELWKKADLSIALTHSEIYHGNIIHRVISDDLDPDMDGEYIEVSVHTRKKSNSDQLNTKWLKEALIKLITISEIDPKTMHLIDIPHIDELQIFSDSNITLQFKQSHDSYYSLQFIRLTTQTNNNHKNQEWATSSTLIYWLKKYNGWAIGHESVVWQQFCQNNQSTLEGLFKHLSCANSRVTQEVEELGKKCSTQTIKLNLFKSVLQWQKNNVLFENVLIAFNAFLDEQNKLYQSRILHKLSVIKSRLEY